MERQECFDDLKDVIVKGRIPDAEAATQALIDAGAQPQEMLDAMTAAMQVVGDLFAEKKYYIPQVLISANAFEKGFKLVQPMLEAANRGDASSDSIVMGVCEGDIHDIGKKIVCAMWKAAGFVVYDVGKDVPNKVFLEEREKHQARFVGQSALMTTSAQEMREFVELAEETGVRGDFKFVIGGGAVTDGFGKIIGADGYSADGTAAVELVRALAEGERRLI